MDSLSLKPSRFKIANQRFGTSEVFVNIVESEYGISISQKIYVQDILYKTGLLDLKPVAAPMAPNVRLLPAEGEPLSDLGRYHRLFG